MCIRDRTWENAGTSRTSSKVRALPSRRMLIAPKAAFYVGPQTHVYTEPLHYRNFTQLRQNLHNDNAVDFFTYAIEVN